ncbi:MAG: ATP-binding cassette domain-containing protein [Acidobacteria bacterium]|nr:MAG: ATP-binding cassette domain-containing protein [Acidobacteriota bacterium]REK07092.1 MAG: ATP-binding cassette domain-containing protein [Acidobacteriota bacterium]
MSHAPTAPEVHISEVSKTFPGGPVALDRVTMTLPAGSTTALIGESGSGKSTLLRTVNRLVEPDLGEVSLDGLPVHALDPVALRRTIGYVQQSGGLLPHWTVQRNVELVPQLLGWSRARRATRSHELLELLGLPPARFAGRYPHELSGGQQQRVAIARALAADPALVLLDEPFGALDAITRGELHDEFRRLRDRLDKTMIVVTHDLAEAFALADNIAVLHRGELVRFGTVAELQRDAGHDYVERLLAHLPGAGTGARVSADREPGRT